MRPGGAVCGMFRPKIDVAGGFPARDKSVILYSWVSIGRNSWSEMESSGIKRHYGKSAIYNLKSTV